MSLNVVAPATTLANTRQMQFIQHSVEIYKNFIRPFLAESKIYHHTPEPKESCVIEITASDQAKGAIGVFAMTEGAQRITVYPKGLDLGSTYRVTMDNSGAVFEKNGYDLMSQGLVVNLPASMASELILYEVK